VADARGRLAPLRGADGTCGAADARGRLALATRRANSIEEGEWGISAAEVDEFDCAGGATEEAGAETLEFFGGVGGETTDLSGRRVGCCG